MADSRLMEVKMAEKIEAEVRQDFSHKEKLQFDNTTNYRKNTAIMQRKSLGIIQCFDCRQHAELDGYRFALVPLCECCRTEREVKITGNRFERRHKR